MIALNDFKPDSHFPLQGKPINKPLRLCETPPAHFYREGLRKALSIYRSAIQKEFAGRRPVMIDITEWPITMKHQKTPDDTKCRTGCPACELEKRAAKGQPVVSFLVEIERNSLTEFTLLPKRSRRARQAKKFRKLDVMTEQPVRLTEVWRMSRLQVTLLREEWDSLRYPHSRKVHHA